MVRGKGTKDRMEPIYPCEETFELIEEYLKAIPTNHKIKKDGVLTPLILSSSNRNFLGRISRNGIRAIMNKALEACNLKHPGYSCHVFRHSCGTNLYHETKDLRLVQDILRHRDPKVTARCTPMWQTGSQSGIPLDWFRMTESTKQPLFINSG